MFVEKNLHFSTSKTRKNNDYEGYRPFVFLHKILLDQHKLIIYDHEI